MTGLLRRALHVVVAATVVATASAGTVATAGAGTPTGRKGSPAVVGRPPADGVGVCAAGSLAFGRERYVHHRDEVARLGVRLPDSLRGESVVLTLGSEDGPYRAAVALADGDGDADVTLLFDATTAGTGRPTATLRAADGDRATGRSETDLDGPLPQGPYDLTVRGDGCRRADATLVVEGPGPVAVGAYAGRAVPFDDLTDPAAVRAALADGGLSARPAAGAVAEEPGVAVLPGDVVVLALHAPLASAVRATGGANDTVRLRSLLGDAVTVRLVESETSLDAGEEPERYRLPDFERWRAVADPGNGTYYLVVDTGAGVAGDARRTDFGAAGTGYVVEVAVPDAGTATAGVGFPVPDATVARSPAVGAVVLRPAADATVSGTTNLPDGARVAVRLEGDAGPFPVERHVAVEDGGFSASFYLDNYEPGWQFSVVVRHRGETVATAPGRVGPAATVRLRDRRVDGRAVGRVVVDAVATTHGGFVVVHRGSPGGPVLGRSGFLPPGNHSDVAVSLDGPLAGDATLVAVAYRDAAGDEAFQPGRERPYAGGRPSDAARFRGVGGTLSETWTNATSPAGSVPGPGVALAVAALAVAALAARLRRRSAGGDGP